MNKVPRKGIWSKLTPDSVEIYHYNPWDSYIAQKMRNQNLAIGFLKHILYFTVRTTRYGQSKCLAEILNISLKFPQMLIKCFTFKKQQS